MKSNISKNADIDLYAQVKAAFLLRGTTFNRWCIENGVYRQNAAQALKGVWKGEQSRALCERLVLAAGLDIRVTKTKSSKKLKNINDSLVQFGQQGIVSTVKEQEALIQIMAILRQLNAYEAKNVISATCNSLGQTNEHFAQKKIRRLSKIELDRELYEFIMSLDLEFMTQADVRDVCIDKFGKDRAPSRTGLNRAFNKLLNGKGD
ncbi:hypothetical protein [Vibrio campbellii]|uniref:hypothetical protein n=1 Tax=Vibrio campbellii TaxID=680 RepID=UPI0020161110|nr:hypothetical protein [Vibrio campbellii]